MLIPTGRPLLIRVKGTDTTIYIMKSRIEISQSIPSGEHSKPSSEHNFRQVCFCLTDRPTRLIFSLDGIWRINEQFPNMRSRKTTFSKLFNICAMTAVDLTSCLSPSWFTVITQGNNATGFLLSKGDIVTVGRIVNDEWYQGFQDEDICGYFPRAFVSVRK